MNADPSEVFVHPLAQCESSSIGPGTRVWAFAQVLEGASIGRNCNICGGAFVEGGAVIGNSVTVKNNSLVFSGVRIEDDCFIGPGVIFTNDPKPRIRNPTPHEAFEATKVEAGASIGAGCTILSGLTVRRGAFVAAGSLVTRDVAAFAAVKGRPAVRWSWVCGCGLMLDESLGCACGRVYSLESESAGLRLESAAG